MKNFLFSSFLFMAFLFAFPQTVTLTFTGQDASNNHIQLDSVLVTNQTRGWQEMLYWPDTVLTMQNGVGIDDNAAGMLCASSLQLAQNTPNPFNGTTDVTLYVADEGMVTLEITDMNGRIVGTTHVPSLQYGTYLFRLTLPTAGTYILTARQNGKTTSIKMANNGMENVVSIEYVGEMVKTTPTLSLQPKSGIRGTTSNPFQYGDMMQYVGYATINGAAETSQEITEAQNNAQTFTLQFEAVQMRLATVTTAVVSGIAQTVAVVGGEVTADGGSAVTDRGVCWNTTGNPTISDNCQPIGSGIGIFSYTLTGLTPNTGYYVRAYAINGVGVSYGTEESFTTWNIPQDGQPCPGTPNVTDIDNNVYGTVQIGNQCWMKENMKTKKFADGTPIDPGTSTSYDMAYWYYPDNNSANQYTYGLLYNWLAVMGSSASSNLNPSGVQGICPNGWHVPSDAEWTQMTDYVSSQNGFQCGGTPSYIAKALASTAGWQPSDGACAVGNTLTPNNDTGFGAMPSGFYVGSYNYLNESAYFWTTTEYSTMSAWFRYMKYNSANVSPSYGPKYSAFSVRCIHD